MYTLTGEDKLWLDTIWQRTEKKIEAEMMRNTDKFPYFSRTGVYDDKSNDICWWTNGFWPGIMWLMFDATGKENYKEYARHLEEKLDRAFYEYFGLHHDVGFMWMLSAGADYRLTGNEQSQMRCIHAANILAGRYNAKGEFIQAWNSSENAGKTIIDSMMNLSLLYYVGELTNDGRFSSIAEKHADKTLKYHIREDSSVNHIVRFDIETGEKIETLGGQGYKDGSAWSRGQAWAIYGFVISYLHTKNQSYLDAAVRCADYFIECVRDNWLTPSDFKAPPTPVVYDLSAGACAASAFIEIAKILDAPKAKKYIDAAINILKAMSNSFCDWDIEHDSILQKCSEAYKGTRNISLIYGDYFYVEAINKLRGGKHFFW